MRPRLQFFLCSGALAIHSPSWTRRTHLLRDGSPARSVPHGQDGLRVASSSGAGPWRAHPAVSRPRGAPWVLAQGRVCPAPPHVSLGGGGRPLAAPWEVPTARPPPSSRAPCRHLVPSAALPAGLPVRMDGDRSEQTSLLLASRRRLRPHVPASSTAPSMPASAVPAAELPGGRLLRFWLRRASPASGASLLLFEDEAPRKQGAWWAWG